MNPVIEVKGLSKVFKVYEKKKGIINLFQNLVFPRYREIVAVNNVDFTINQGEIVGYIGPNGAGKSTTIKMLTGVLVPSAGELMICNSIPYKSRIKNAMKVGVVFGQKSQLWWDVPVIESYRLLKELYKVDDRQFEKNLSLYSEILDIKNLLHTPVRQLSLGQRMRCDLAASLFHDPEVLFLDEPTIGLDVGVKEKLRSFIKEINAEKKITVILTTHDMKDVEELCSRIIIINNGEKIYDGDLNTVKKKYISHRILKVEFGNNISSLHIPCLEIIREEDNIKWFRFDHRENSVADIMKNLFAQYPIIDFSTTDPGIEEVVKKIC